MIRVRLELAYNWSCTLVRSWIVLCFVLWFVLWGALLLVLWMVSCEHWLSSCYFPDIIDPKSWDRESTRKQAEECSQSGHQQAAWGISETESDLTYGEVEQRLDLLQEQLNRYNQRKSRGQNPSIIIVSLHYYL